MIGDLKTVVITLRPRTGVPEDLGKWAETLTAGLNFARVSSFDGRPSVTVHVRVRTTKRMAQIAAEQWVRDCLGNLPIDVVRNYRVPVPDSAAPSQILLTSGLRPSRWPAARRWALELGLLDVGHTVAKEPVIPSPHPPGSIAQDSDIEVPTATAALMTRRHIDISGPRESTAWMRVIGFVLFLLTTLGPATLAGLALWTGATGWWAGYVISALAAITYWVRTVFKADQIALGTRVLAAAGLIGAASFFGFMVGSSPSALPSIRLLLGTVATAAVGVGLWFTFEAHPSLRRPAALATVIGPVLAAGAVLWGWSLEEVAGIPSTYIALSPFDQLWIAWPIIKTTTITLFILLSFYGWLRYWGFWTAVRDLFRLTAPLILVLYLLYAFIAGMQSVSSQIDQTTSTLQQGKVPTGALGSKIRWVCAKEVPGVPPATYGGERLSFARPLAHVWTTDGSLWLWDPRVSTSARKAVSYSADSISLRWVDSGDVTCPSLKSP